MEDLIKNLLEASNNKDYEAASKSCIEYFLTANASEKALIKQAMLQKATMLLDEANEARKQADELLKQIEIDRMVTIEVGGQKYNSKDWLTYSGYCKKYQLKSTSIITNWIKRGVIPPSNIVSIKELDIKLIKAIPYMRG